MPTAADYYIAIDGQDVTSRFDPLLISLTITDSDGGKSDTCEITLDDTDGQIAFPRQGADLEARIWARDDPQRRAIAFKGKTDEPKSHGSRNGGLTLSITAHSADMKGEGKHKTHRHKDGGTFKDAATQFGKAAGFTVKCDDATGAVKRAYWAMSGESFYSWGQRLAAEIGATFKVQGKEAAFVSRNGSSSASGSALAGVDAVDGRNVISWDIAPVTGRPQYESAKVRWYDQVAAKWMEEVAPMDTGGGS